jgi:hypothetical protein
MFMLSSTVYDEVRTAVAFYIIGLNLYDNNSDAE